MSSTAVASSSSDATPRFTAVETMPRPSGFVSTKRIAGHRRGVPKHAPGVHEPEHDHAVLRLGIGDRVATEHRDAHGARRIDTALQHAAEHLGGRSSIGQLTMLSPRNGVPPIAYTSLIAFVAAMRPQS